MWHMDINPSTAAGGQQPQFLVNDFLMNDPLKREVGSCRLLLLKSIIVVPNYYSKHLTKPWQSEYMLEVTTDPHFL